MNGTKTLFRVEEDGKILAVFVEEPHDNLIVNDAAAYSPKDGFMGACMLYVRKHTKPADIGSEAVKKVIKYLESKPEPMKIVPVERNTAQFNKNRRAKMR